MKIIKDIIQVLACGIILVSVGANINNQLGTLLEARQKNKELAEEIKKLSEENRIWERKIEYATSSAFLEQEVRDKLGMGGRDDYWVILPSSGSGTLEDLTPMKDVGAKPIWRQWLELFMIE